MHIFSIFIIVFFLFLSLNIMSLDISHVIPHRSRESDDSATFGYFQIVFITAVASSGKVTTFVCLDSKLIHPGTCAGANFSYILVILQSKVLQLWAVVSNVSRRLYIFIVTSVNDLNAVYIHTISFHSYLLDIRRLLFVFEFFHHVFI